MPRRPEPTAELASEPIAKIKRARVEQFDNVASK